MAKITQRLSAVAVTNLSAPGLHSDGDGLYLRITATRTKSWIFRYSSNGRLHDMGLGSLNAVSLSKARKLAAECRRLRGEGLDPIRARDAVRAKQRLASARAMTFRECAEQVIGAYEAGWRNAKHRQQWRNTLDAYAHPFLGDMDVADVGTDHVLSVLQQDVSVAPSKTLPLWNAKTETASRVRGRIEAVLAWAKARGLRAGENPAQWRGHIDQLLPRRAKVRRVEHHSALPYAEIPSFMAKLRANDGISARALEFVILTASRTGEALGAKFDEFDLDAKLWTVPAERMKGAREHRVALSSRAVAIITEMAEIRLGDYVFPGLRSGRPLTDMALLMLLRDLRPGITTHGFRSSFKDWSSEQTSFADYVSEAALAHVSADKVRAAYARSDLFEKRCKLMEAWGRFCGQQSSKVVPPKRQGVR